MSELAAAVNGAVEGALVASETPNVIYGRLLEAAHFTGYGVERMAGGLEWLLDDGRWRSVGAGFDDVREFMASVTTYDLSLEQRKNIARKLKREHDLSLRAAATAAGIPKSTLHDDLRPDPDTAPLKEGDATSEKRPDPDTLAWMDAPPDTAKRALERDTQREAKERDREAMRDRNRELVTRAPRLADIGGRFATLVLDPPWDWSDEGDDDQFGRATPTYATMPFDEIAAQPISEIAEDDAHLFLWITNRSLPKGFALLERWGFRYVTALTWVKPSIGMGNYFRGSTEHVLFGIRGSLPLLRQNVGTHFSAPRPPQHSQKPEAFYELVQSCSPGPWFEWPARRDRAGWVVSGAEVTA